MTDPVTRYRGDAGRRYHESKRGVPEPALPWVIRLRAEKLRNDVRPTDTVVEYGVGWGWNLAGLECARRIGVDVTDLLRAEVERRGIDFALDTASLAGGLADVVVCHHTLEHLLAPAAALAEMLRLLRPGGRLLLWVPLEIERRYRRFDRNEPNHHLYSWNVQTLGLLVESCGFRVAEAGVGRYGYDRFAASCAVRWRLGEAGFRTLRAVMQFLRPLREVRVLAEKPAEAGAGRAVCS